MSAREATRGERGERGERCEMCHVARGTTAVNGVWCCDDCAARCGPFLRASRLDLARLRPRAARPRRWPPRRAG